ncbi:cora-like Mg2+ transporter protein-domain-containing protein [Hyaloraphidium curvatum]|nr:cora-like Mg2+ transporter protein-domain-containing protein [Hyaloraphidium curvatum]
MLGPDLVSPLSKLFLGDVLDHLSTVLDVVDLLERSAGDLIDLIFNTIATNTNDNMRILAIVSVVFVPCTFLTGFFGQNLVYFPELEIPGGSQTIWLVCAGIMLFTLVLLGVMGMLDCECCYAKSVQLRRRRLKRGPEKVQPPPYY